MEKNVLNEVNKIRKMMGLNDNLIEEGLKQIPDPSVDNIGIVNDRGNIIPGYFQKQILVAVGDMVKFDKSGNLLKPGGGYPSGGFKEHNSPKDLEYDICKNYNELLGYFRDVAPKVVQLNEGSYNIVKASVECYL